VVVRGRVGDLMEVGGRIGGSFERGKGKGKGKDEVQPLRRSCDPVLEKLSGGTVISYTKPP